ncbi:hypothetical protein MRX96_031045 [Rhipicephalus microplus]
MYPTRRSSVARRSETFEFHLPRKWYQRFNPPPEWFSGANRLARPCCARTLAGRLHAAARYTWPRPSHFFGSRILPRAKDGVVAHSSCRMLRLSVRSTVYAS